MSEQAAQPRSHHHRHARESLMHRVWRQYRFEIIWLVLVAAGLFLIFEQMDIRKALARWLRTAAAMLLSSATRLNAQVGAFIDRATASDILGYLLILVAIVAIVARLRWRVMHSPALTTLCCPKCGGNIHRKHRTTADRFISLSVPVRRYRCVNSECRWQGLRVTSRHGVPQPVSVRGSNVR